MRTTGLALFITLVFFYSQSSAAIRTVHSVQQQKPDIQRIINPYRQYGICIGIEKNDSASYYSIGQVKNKSQAIDSSTMFEIGSISKTFTGLLLASQIEKGAVHATDLIDRYIPQNVNLPVAIRRKVTLADLASHQSGLPTFIKDSFTTTLVEANADHPYAAVNKNYLYQVLSHTNRLIKFHEYNYSNFGFALLGLLLSNQANMPYEALVKKNVFDPLALGATKIRIVDSGNIAGRYNADEITQVPMDAIDMAPAAGAKSSAADLLKYLRAQMTPPAGALGNAIRRSHQPLFTSKDISIGYAWEINSGYLEKTGSTFGNSAVVRFDAASKTAVVVLIDHIDPEAAKKIINEVFAAVQK